MTKNACNTIIGCGTGLFIGLIFAFLGTQVGISVKHAILTAIGVAIVVGLTLTIIFWLIIPDDTEEE